MTNAFSMIFPFTTQSATFRERPNRFLVRATLREGERAGETVAAHCPDRGRLAELLIPGVTAHLSYEDNPARKTDYTLRFVEHPEHGQLVSLDTRLPNAVFAEGLASGFFAPFRAPQFDAQIIEREVTAPHAPGPARSPRARDAPARVKKRPRSRIDFRLSDGDGKICWVEVKSASLVEGRVAIFPDAPTERGRRHVEHLAWLHEKSTRAAVVFIVQRPDADSLMPHWRTDPAFGEALVAARMAGVEIYAYTCHLTKQEIRLAQEIPVVLERGSQGNSSGHRNTGQKSDDLLGNRKR